MKIRDGRGRVRPSLFEETVLDFWSKVERGKRTECWKWKGRVLSEKEPYGYVTIQGKTFRAHRIAFLLYYGKFPSYKFVLHQCDNMRCCNPHHLFLGTQKDNVDDCISKNRRFIAVGVKCRHAKLTPEKIKRMRYLYFEENWTQTQLARLYKVDQSIISRAVRKENWKSVI